MRPNLLLWGHVRPLSPRAGREPERGDPFSSPEEFCLTPREADAEADGSVLVFCCFCGSWEGEVKDSGQSSESRISPDDSHDAGTLLGSEDPSALHELRKTAQYKD